MMYGYVKSSTSNTASIAEITLLKAAGAEAIYQDNASDQPELQKLMALLTSEDTVLITAVERLTRSTSDLLCILNAISHVGARCYSIADRSQDLASPAGRILIHSLTSIADYEAKQMEQTKFERVRSGDLPPLDLKN